MYGNRWIGGTIHKKRCSNNNVTEMRSRAQDTHTQWQTANFCCYNSHRRREQDKRIWFILWDTESYELRVYEAIEKDKWLQSKCLNKWMCSYQFHCEDDWIHCRFIRLAMSILRQFFLYCLENDEFLVFILFKWQKNYVFFIILLSVIAMAFNSSLEFPRIFCHCTGFGNDVWVEITFS